MSAYRVYFQILKVTKASTSNIGKYERLATQLEYSYGRHINESYNNELEYTIIKLPAATPYLYNQPPYKLSTNSADITAIADTDHSSRDDIVLRPDYLATELVVRNGVSVFGKHFGVSFHNQIDVRFGRHISLIELLMCYSTKDPSTQPSYLLRSGQYH